MVRGAAPTSDPFSVGDAGLADRLGRYRASRSVWRPRHKNSPLVLWLSLGVGILAVAFIGVLFLDGRRTAGEGPPPSAPRDNTESGEAAIDLDGLSLDGPWRPSLGGSQPPVPDRGNRVSDGSEGGEESEVGSPSSSVEVDDPEIGAEPASADGNGSIETGEPGAAGEPAKFDRDIEALGSGDREPFDEEFNFQRVWREHLEEGQPD